MDELKTILFQKTHRSYLTYKYERFVFPQENWEQSRTIFCNLYSVVREAGLSDEFNEWVKQREEEA